MSSFLIAHAIITNIIIEVKILFRFMMRYRILATLHLTFKESLFSLCPKKECWRNINRGRGLKVKSAKEPTTTCPLNDQIFSSQSMRHMNL